MTQKVLKTSCVLNEWNLTFLYDDTTRNIFYVTTFAHQACVNYNLGFLCSLHSTNKRLTNQLPILILFGINKLAFWLTDNPYILNNVSLSSRNESPPGTLINIKFLVL